jgi:hypothetical protein
MLLGAVLGPGDQEVIDCTDAATEFVHPYGWRRPRPVGPVPTTGTIDLISSP